MKLTKQQAKLHAEADRLTRLDRELTLPEREFVLDHWHEAATHDVTQIGAHFTPQGLASDMKMHVNGDRIIDLCAGIGLLARTCVDIWAREPQEFVCVERNPEYVRVGRKVFPEARWIEADVRDVPRIVAELGLGRFDCAISNPPFGRLPGVRDVACCAYTGSLMEYHVVGVAAQVADRGVFLLPQTSVPFRYSGRHRFEWDDDNANYRRFVRETGIELGMNVGVDTSYYAGEWRTASPMVEIATCRFDEWAARGSEAGQLALGVS